MCTMMPARWHVASASGTSLRTVSSMPWVSCADGGLITVLGLPTPAMQKSRRKAREEVLQAETRRAVSDQLSCNVLAESPASLARRVVPMSTENI